MGQGKVVRILRHLPPTSLLLWGPPGTGKTTAAYLLAKQWGLAPLYFSAVVHSISEVKRAMEGEDLLGPKLIFLDELHRYNKAQQAAFLPYLEDGRVILIATTTENPSFEVIPPLLSRMKVFRFEPLSPEEIRRILERGIKNLGARLSSQAMEKLVSLSGGDARVALTTLEIAHGLARGEEIKPSHVEEAAGERHGPYDKAGDYHYDLLSAYHKSLRNSDPDAALYWLARMVVGGQDMGPILRRLIMASVEDVSLADPMAFEIAVRALQAYQFLGSPEGDLAVAYATIYVALAPKSNSAYRAWNKAKRKAKETSHLPVPLHLRNPVTSLMKKQGYGEGYLYAHDFPQGTTPMECFPQGIKESFYVPGERGFEREMAKRLRWFQKIKKEMEKGENF